ncbi:hypothetical protein IJ22_19090 [Paenibacillus naphthalenovorans]|uniref:Uncharacterized protein n=1 Tax=Paenibacillus naphthalenovorans TaxID=162209 RepID=A0A0U2IM94_9BACL|nr:hypothetical protein IJ22_19090 [Paenibacillus naphthalenovorans]
MFKQHNIVNYLSILTSIILICSISSSDSDITRYSVYILAVMTIIISFISILRTRSHNR